MKLADLFVKLGLKKDGFDKGIDGAKKKTNTFGSAVKKIGGLMAGAFAVGAITNFTKQAIRAYDVQAQAESQLLVALKGREEVQKRLIMQASSLQGVTLFGDEETIRAQALIAAFVKEGDQIERIIPLVQDLATAKSMSLAGAADLVSKTLGSSTNALSRYGIEVEGTVGSVDRLESLMKGLNSAFGGQAEAAAKTGAGALIQLQNAIGDLKEEFGKAIVQGESFNEYIRGSTKEIQDYALVFSESAKGGFGKFLKFLRNSTGNIKEQAEAIREVNKEIENAGPFKIDFEDDGGDFEFPEWEEQIKTIADLKKETDDLKKSIDEYSVTQDAEIQKTLKQIKANDDLIESLTSLKHAYTDVPDQMTSIGTPADLFTAPELDTSILANMDSFREKLKDQYATFVADAEEEGNNLGEALSSGLANSLSGIGQAVGDAIAGGGWDDFGKAILGIVGNFMQTLGAAIIAIGIGLLNLEASLSTGNAFGVIAAGVALTVAGAALSSIVSGGIKGGGSSGGASSYSPGASSASAAIAGDVSFVLEGDKLVGAIDGNRRRRRITG